MTDDKKLPAVRPQSSPVGTDPPGYLTTPTARGNFLDRLIGRMRHRDRTRTIEAATGELVASKEHLSLQEQIFEQAGKTAQAADRYYYETPTRIQNNREEFDHDIRLASNRREIEWEEAQQRLEEAKAVRSGARAQRDHGGKVAAFNQEAELAQAEFSAKRARWGNEAFEQSMTFRRDRIADLYKTGQLDAELERTIREGYLDKQRRDNAAAAGLENADTGAASEIPLALAEVEDEIETAHKTHATPEALAALYSLKARLLSKLKT